MAEKSYYNRIIINLFLLAGLYFLPWWLMVLAILAATFLLKSYYECFVFGLLLDSLYGSQIFYPTFPYIFTFWGVVAFYIMNRFKNHFRFYGI